MSTVAFALILARVGFGEGKWASVLSPNCTPQIILCLDLVQTRTWL